MRFFGWVSQSPGFAGLSACLLSQSPEAGSAFVGEAPGARREPEGALELVLQVVCVGIVADERNLRERLVGRSQKLADVLEAVFANGRLDAGVGNLAKAQVEEATRDAHVSRDVRRGQAACRVGHDVGDGVLHQRPSGRWLARGGRARADLRRPDWNDVPVWSAAAQHHRVQFLRGAIAEGLEVNGDA